MSETETYILLSIGLAGLILGVGGSLARKPWIANTGGGLMLAYVGLLYAAVRLLTEGN